MKSRVVIELNDSCRVLTNPRPEDYQDYVHVKDPDLSCLVHTSPEQWVIRNGQVILKMPVETEPGAISRLPTYEKFGSRELNARIDALSLRLRANWVGLGILCIIVFALGSIVLSHT